MTLRLMFVLKGWPDHSTFVLVAQIEKWLMAVVLQGGMGTTKKGRDDRAPTKNLVVCCPYPLRILACAAANRATGTRNGEQLT